MFPARCCPARGKEARRSRHAASCKAVKRWKDKAARPSPDLGRARGRIGAGPDTIGAQRVANEDGIAETIPSPNLSRNADIMSLSQAAPIRGGQITQCRPRRAAELSSGVPAVWRCGKNRHFAEGGHFTPSGRDHLPPTDSLEPGDVGESTVRSCLNLGRGFWQASPDVASRPQR